MANPIAQNVIKQKHQIYKSIWGKLSNDGRQNVSSKSQLMVSYCKLIAGSKEPPKNVPASTIYDLCQFASEELEKEIAAINEQLKESNNG